jgi:hypothetical protein
MPKQLSKEHLPMLVFCGVHCVNAMSNEKRGHCAHAAGVGTGVGAGVGECVAIAVVVVVFVVDLTVVTVVQLAAAPLPSAFCEHTHAAHTHGWPLVTQRLRL